MPRPGIALSASASGGVGLGPPQPDSPTSLGARSGRWAWSAARRRGPSNRSAHMSASPASPSLRSGAPAASLRLFCAAMQCPREVAQRGHAVVGGIGASLSRDPIRAQSCRPPSVRNPTDTLRSSGNSSSSGRFFVAEEHGAEVTSPHTRNSSPKKPTKPPRPWPPTRERSRATAAPNRPPDAPDLHPELLRLLRAVRTAYVRQDRAPTQDGLHLLLLPGLTGTTRAAETGSPTIHLSSASVRTHFSTPSMTFSRRGSSAPNDALSSRPTCPKRTNAPTTTGTRGAQRSAPGSKRSAAVNTGSSPASVTRRSQDPTWTPKPSASSHVGSRHDSPSWKPNVAPRPLTLSRSRPTHRDTTTGSACSTASHDSNSVSPTCQNYSAKALRRLPPGNPLRRT
jgi:hypothetical protein